MLSVQDEKKLSEWFERQKKNIKDKFGVEVIVTFSLDMNKPLIDNKNILEEQLKVATLKAQGIEVQEKKVKSPFKNISNAEYKNILRQLQEQNQQDLAFTPKDVGEDATEQMAIAYFKNNCGLIIKSRDESKANAKQQAEAQRLKLQQDYNDIVRKEREQVEARLEERAIKIMANGGCPLLDKAEQIHTYLKLQNLGCEHITLLSQFGLFGLGTKFLFEGAQGIGKSRASIEQLERFMVQLQDMRILVLSGHITPLQMYEILFNHRHKKDLLAIDEGFFIINDELIQQMLKDALFRGKVYWQSKSKLAEHLPADFEWEGSILINANQLIKRDNPNTAAFLDRLMTFKVVLTNEQIIEKMNSSRAFRFDTALEQEMVDRIIAIRSGKVNVELTEADLDYIYDFVTSEVHFLLTQYSHISFRTLQKCRQLYTCFKLYFGGVNQFTKNWFEQIAKQIVKGNTAENFIISTLKQANSRMKSLELVNLIMEHYSVGKTQAYDRLNLLKENGVIEGNREIILCNKNAN